MLRPVHGVHCSKISDTLPSFWERHTRIVTDYPLLYLSNLDMLNLNRLVGLDSVSRELREQAHHFGGAVQVAFNRFVRYSLGHGLFCVVFWQSTL
jgi:hypothetical protein